MRDGLRDGRDTRVNDLIFKSFLRGRVAREDGTTYWDVADSKLWYITPEQAKGFLAITESDAYRASVTAQEIDLLRKHIAEIVASAADIPTNIIDLGCGDGGKAVMCMDAFMDAAPVRYCPVDISAYMVQTAAHAVRKRGLAPVEEILWNVSDFENLTNIEPLFRSKSFPRHCFLLLGNTLGNFDAYALVHHVRRAMRTGDMLVVGNGLLGSASPESLVAAYSVPEMDAFCQYVPLRAGIPRSVLDFSVHYIDGRVEVCYIVRKAHRSTHVQGTIMLAPGDVIRVGVSHKFTRDALETLLRKTFTDVTLFVHPSEGYGLAACRA